MSAKQAPNRDLEIDGFLILDKPLGLSSNRALQRVKKHLNARKAGHCGSLDPLASGVLPISLGQATRFSDYLLSADKTYLASCQLGKTTTTGDAEGEVLETKPVDVDLAKIEAVLRQFEGESSQIPPMYSALKREGVPLYKLARKGLQVEREARKITVYEIALCAYGDQQLDIEVRCSKGTYIRVLAEDIGAALGCGAHLRALRRTQAASFGEQDSISLEALEAQVSKDPSEPSAPILPVTAALSRFPVLELSSSEAIDICHGKRFAPATVSTAGIYQLILSGGRFLGLGEVTDEGLLKSKRLMNTAS